MYFGQEINNSTYNLARMNMILHNVPIENQFLRNADTLDEDWPVDEPTNFDGVMMNPPYSAKWPSSDGFLEQPRFAPYGVLAPKSYADYAFLQHGFHHLKNDGVMAIVLPHGPLFRGGREGTIRKTLLEIGAIDTVIGLPSDVFFNTGIPTIIMVLKKNRDNRKVFFIDASEEFERIGTQNILNDEHLEKIINAYINKEEIDKFSYLAEFEEIEENDFNLNIPRYVDTFEEEEEIPLPEVSTNLNETKSELREVEEELLEMLNSLQGTNPEADKELQEFISDISGDING